MASAASSLKGDCLGAGVVDTTDTWDDPNESVSISPEYSPSLPVHSFKKKTTVTSTDTSTSTAVVSRRRARSADTNTNTALDLPIPKSARVRSKTNWKSHRLGRIYTCYEQHRFLEVIFLCASQQCLDTTHGNSLRAVCRLMQCSRSICKGLLQHSLLWKYLLRSCRGVRDMNYPTGPIVEFDRSSSSLSSVAGRGRDSAVVPSEAYAVCRRACYFYMSARQWGVQVTCQRLVHVDSPNHSANQKPQSNAQAQDKQEQEPVHEQEEGDDCENQHLDSDEAWDEWPEDPQYSQRCTTRFIEDIVNKVHPCEDQQRTCRWALIPLSNLLPPPPPPTPVTMLSVGKKVWETSRSSSSSSSSLPPPFPAFPADEGNGKVGNEQTGHASEWTLLLRDLAEAAGCRQFAQLAQQAKSAAVLAQMLMMTQTMRLRLGGAYLNLHSSSVPVPEPSSPSGFLSPPYAYAYADERQGQEQDEEEKEKENVYWLMPKKQQYFDDGMYLPRIACCVMKRSSGHVCVAQGNHVAEMSRSLGVV